MRTLFILIAFIICIFILLLILYIKFGLFKKFFHDILGYHMPTNERGFDGCSPVSKCKYCGKEILQDSQGNWF